VAAALESTAAQSVAFVTTRNGTGSGVLISGELVVTNAHVVWPFTVVTVRFPGGDRRSARVLGVDPKADLALLEVAGPGLPPPLEIGSASRLVSGTPLYVVGYPGALELAPEPSVTAATLGGIVDWEFSGVTWIGVAAPAVAGQSGGALVDGAGRLVGITTFGSAVEVFAIDATDAVAVAETLTLRTSRSETRRPPRSGGQLEHEVVIEGPWQQATFVVWVDQGSASHLQSSPSLRWRALDPFGVSLGGGGAELGVIWSLGWPGILHADASEATSATVMSDVPLVPAQDPDDGRPIYAGVTTTGFVDVPGDRDWYYLDLAEPTTVTVTVEGQTRMRVALYERATAALVADVVNRRGFFFDDPPLVAQVAAGGYVVVVEDVAAQFGTYRIDLG